jgi:hypothetical protein
MRTVVKLAGSIAVYFNAILHSSELAAKAIIAISVRPITDVLDKGGGGVITFRQTWSGTHSGQKPPKFGCYVLQMSPASLPMPPALHGNGPWPFDTRRTRKGRSHCRNSLQVAVQQAA